MRTPGYRSLAALTLLFATANADAAVMVYTDQTAFLSALDGLGYSAVHEGFENDAAWGGVRSTISGGFFTAPSVSNLGVTWTSNNLSSQITTSTGAGDGDWGLFSYPHGSYTSPDPGADCLVAGDCGDGFRGHADSGVFYAVGGWLDTNTPYAKLGMFIGSWPDNPVDFGETCTGSGASEVCTSNAVIGTEKQFFGVIDATGFTDFELRELEGTSGDAKYIFADDFYLAGSAVGNVPLPASAALFASALLGLLGVAGRRRTKIPQLTPF